MTLSLKAAGAWAAGTTAPAPTAPTHAAEDLLLLLQVGKPTTTGTNPTGSPTGWTATSGGFNINDGAAQGVDVGDTYARIHLLEATGAGTTVSLSTPNASVMGAAIMAVDKATDKRFRVTAYGVRDTTSGTGLALANTVDLAPGDLVLLNAGIPGDNATFGAWTFAASGITFDTPTKATADLSTSLGNDLAGSVVYAKVTAGTDAAVSFTASNTLSAAQKGVGILLVIREVDRTPTLFSTGAGAEGTTSVTPVNPVHLAGHRLIAHVNAKPDATGTPPVFSCATDGWAEIPGAAGTSGTGTAQSADTGQNWCTAFYNDADSASEPNPVISVTNGNTCVAVVQAFTKDPAKSWEAPVGATGADTSSGTAFSATTGAISIGVDDLLSVLVAPEGNTAMSAQAVSATGMTFGTTYPSIAEDLQFFTTLGNDIEASVGHFHIIAGTEASVAVTVTATFGTARTGMAVVVRLRQSAAGGTDATATPAVHAATVAFPASSQSTGATETPAAVAAVVAFPAAVPSVGVTKSPTVAAAVVAFPAATASASTTATPTPAAIAAVVAFPAASAQGHALATPAVIAAVVDVPAAGPSADWTLSPALFGAVVAFPAAVPTTGGSGSQAVIAAVVAFPAASPRTGMTAAPAVLAAVVAFPAVAPSTGYSAEPDVIAAVVAFPTPTVPLAADVAPDAFAVVVAFPQLLALVPGVAIISQTPIVRFRLDPSHTSHLVLSDTGRRRIRL